MIILNHNKQIDYLIKMEGVKPKTEKQMVIKFVKSFNKEARKQNSKWFAEFKEHTSFIDGRKFILLHIHKRLINGGWIFKNIKTTSLHMMSDGESHHYSFVDNDFVFSDYGKEKNDYVFKYLPEVKPILEKIPQAFFILPKEKVGNFEIEFTRIKKEIEELEQKVF